MKNRRLSWNVYYWGKICKKIKWQKMKEKEWALRIKSRASKKLKSLDVSKEFNLDRVTKFSAFEAIRLRYKSYSIWMFSSSIDLYFRIYSSLIHTNLFFLPFISRYFFICEPSSGFFSNRIWVYCIFYFFYPLTFSLPLETLEFCFHPSINIIL